jgi:MtN3 and saliva related transmembrane protein
MENNDFNVQLIGAIGAVLTTICWAPQAWRVIRYRNTHAISLATNLALLAGQFCWLYYGIALNNWPLIVSNTISIMFTVVIVTMKVRYG